MIERFTKEELKIIKKELQELEKDRQKRELCDEAFKKLRNAYRNGELSGSPHPYEIENSILFICDCFMGNFKSVPQNGMKFKGKYCRASYVDKGIAKEYENAVYQIVEVLVNHSRKFEEE